MPDDVVELTKGQFVWYVKANVAEPLPAQLLSDGICETKKTVKGDLIQYAHLRYGTADPTHVLLGHVSPPAKPGDKDDVLRLLKQRQTQEVTAPWDPTGTPGSWHLPDEAKHLEHPALAGAAQGADKAKPRGDRAPQAP
jgi:hypothetical protein